MKEHKKAMPNEGRYVTVVHMNTWGVCINIPSYVRKYQLTVISVVSVPFIEQK